eukprot:gene9111-6402_t
MAHKKQAWSKRVKKERFKKKYLTRMQATRLLQMDSIHFRRMCILKGVYPRALARSKQKQSGNEKQYYLAREIKWLVRDHVAEKMMAHRAWEKKVKRAEAMGLKDNLKLLHSPAVKPQHSLVATIKERYPYFIDAVKDIDDAMSMITLYAFLSPEVKSESTVETHHTLTSGLHERARATCDAWNEYVTKAKVLSKGFISIKGYYYEAIVRNERVRWLSPHEYAHKFPPGIQQYVMLSFLEFYLDLMKFVLLKLNADLKREQEEEEKNEVEGSNTNAEDFEVPAASLEVDATQSTRAKAAETATAQSLIQVELRKIRKVFEGLSFYISREVPFKHAALVINCCGGRVATEYVPSNITHVVVDRPSLPPGWVREEHIEYVQPQYLFDCLNARLLLPVAGYRMGEELPPHVSPFTVAITNMPEDIAAVEKAKKDHPKIVSYVPQRVHEIRKLINPAYTAVDPDGKVAALEQDYSDDEAHVAAPELDRDDDVSLSGDELEEARRRPKWEEEEVTENVKRSALSALKVRKQREMQLMNAPTDEVVARRRQALLRRKEKDLQSESRDVRIKRKLAEVKRQEAAAKKMQLQVARKKAARYYKMVNGVVKKTERTHEALSGKAKQLEEGKIKKSADGTGLLNTRVEAKRERAAAKGVKIKEKKADNPYKKLPKWVR